MSETRSPKPLHPKDDRFQGKGFFHLEKWLEIYVAKPLGWTNAMMKKANDNARLATHEEPREDQTSQSRQEWTTTPLLFGGLDASKWWHA